MNGFVRILWPGDVYRRLIHVMAAIIFVGSYTVAAYIFFLEAKDIWDVGARYFFLDLFIRLIFGLVFDLIALAPYALGSIAARKSGLSPFFLVVCGVVFLLDVWLRIDVLFFPESSTAALALVFSPFYFASLVGVVWAVAIGVQWLLQHSDK